MEEQILGMAITEKLLLISPFTKVFISGYVYLNGIS